MWKKIITLITMLAVNALALLVVDGMFTRIWFDTPGAAIAAAIVLALVNTYVRPMVLFLTLPLNFLTLGLFTLLINAGMLKLVSWLIPAFHVEGFWTAIGGALVLSLVSAVLNLFLKPEGNRVQFQIHRF